MRHPSIEAAPELRKAIGDAEMAADALRRAGLSERASKLEEHIQNARKLRFSIGVVAQAKRGKSTLINGLLGRTDDILAPIDRFPATNVVSCFAQSPKESARVLFETDDEKSHGKVITLDQIKEYACEENNPGNRKGVRVIEVVGPFARLGENVVLVDTPGADNALTRVHDVVLFEFLPKLDAVVFLVTADAPLVEAELELLKNIRKNDVRKLLFAMNKVDKVDGEELQQGLQHNRRVLAQAGFGESPIFSISAKTFHETGVDPGTEKLIRSLEETISEGRAAAIAERLTSLTESHVSAATAEIRTQIENAELTSEQIAEKTTQLDDIRRTFEGNRDRLESKFRASWNEAFDEFEDSLKKIERQLVREYTDLVENCPARDLDSLGGMIHSDVLKSLDELMEPELHRLGETIDGAARELQVQALGAMGIAPREAEQLLTTRQSVFDAAKVPLAGAPALVGAALVGTLPGLVGSAILSAAPAAAALTWNPVTWIAAAGGVAVGAPVSLAAAAVTTVLTPVAIIGVPVLIGYAGLKIFSSWRYQVGKSRNELAIGVKDLIIGAIEETRRNLRRTKAKGDGVLVEFRDSTVARITDAKTQLAELEKNRPTPERIADLRLAEKLIEQVQAPKSLPGPKSDPEETERLFP